MPTLHLTHLRLCLLPQRRPARAPLLPHWPHRLRLLRPPRSPHLYMNYTPFAPTPATSNPSPSPSSTAANPSLIIAASPLPYRSPSTLRPSPPIPSPLPSPTPLSSGPPPPAAAPSPASPPPSAPREKEGRGDNSGEDAGAVVQKRRGFRPLGWWVARAPFFLSSGREGKGMGGEGLMRMEGKHFASLDAPVALEGDAEEARAHLAGEELGGDGDLEEEGRGDDGGKGTMGSCWSCPAASMRLSSS